MKISSRHSSKNAPESVRTAVFPVAGMGTRFLPATKATAKEMMPIVDKPLIQYAVEEALEAGCDRLVFYQWPWQTCDCRPFRRCL